VTAVGPLVDEYRPHVGCRDAAVSADGRPRPGWERALGELARHGPDELDRRQRAADRLVMAEGAGYLLHEGLDATVEPWQVSIVPFMVDPDTWDDLAMGLRQRAELLQAVLQDLAGPRELLRSGTIPVEAVATHPGFARLRASSRDAGGDGLLLVGADVVVDAEGAFRVVRDRTDNPTGEGLALLARAVATRVTPGNSALEPTAGRGVVGHDDYLRALRTRLAAAAPPDRASPRTVVLTGAVDRPGYVENAYLATRLGYSLAEPTDVAVRDGRAWLRSLDGPEQIDVLLRRVPGRGLDPVEEPDVRGGVAGLVHAARRDAVRLVNPVGADLAEHLALLPFLDQAGRFLLGEPLRLPGVPTLWCGDPEHRAQLLAAPERFVLHDTDPANPAPPAVGSQLDEPGLADWRARIEARPERYVAQVDLALGTTPRLRHGRLVPASLSLRTQVLLDGAATTVLPGGHGRLREPGAGADGALVAASGAATDVRVLERPGRRRLHTPGPALPQVDLRRSLPTHAAEAMYWTGRSAERAESGARAALVCLTRVAEGDPSPGDLAAAVDGLRAVSGGMGGPIVESTMFDLDAEVRASLSGRTLSVVDNLRATVRNARAARQLLSARTWRLLAMIDAEASALAKLAGEPRTGSASSTSGSPWYSHFDATEVLDRVLVPLAALSGLTDESVVRGPGWRFLDIGRRLERALLVLGLAEAMLDPPTHLSDLGDGTLRLEALLSACESLAVYRRSFRSDVTVQAVGDLLLGDPTSPRSVRFQLDQLAVDLNDLPARPARQVQLAALREASQALERLLPLSFDPVGGPLGPAARLVIAVRGPLLAIGKLMSSGWFAEPPRRLS